MGSVAQFRREPVRGVRLVAVETRVGRLWCLQALENGEWVHIHRHEAMSRPEGEAWARGYHTRGIPWLPDAIPAAEDLSGGTAA